MSKDKWKVRNKRKAAKSTLNIEVLYDAVAWAINEYNAEKTGRRGSRWNQAQWARGVVGARVLRSEDGARMLQVRCGSAYCVAGNICATAGDRFVVNDDCDTGAVLEVTRVMPVGDPVVWDVEDRAVDLLGINYGEALQLFAGGNAIEKVARIANAIAFENGYDLFLPEIQ